MMGRAARSTREKERGEEDPPAYSERLNAPAFQVSSVYVYACVSMVYAYIYITTGCSVLYIQVPFLASFFIFLRIFNYSSPRRARISLSLSLSCSDILI